MAQEAAATSEALEAERAAKFAADAEARELQRVLDEVSEACRGRRRCSAGSWGHLVRGCRRRLPGTLAGDSAAALGQQQRLQVQRSVPPPPPSWQTNKSLESERAFAQKLGAQAAATQAELKAAMQVGGGWGGDCSACCAAALGSRGPASHLAARRAHSCRPPLCSTGPPHRPPPAPQASADLAARKAAVEGDLADERDHVAQLEAAAADLEGRLEEASEAAEKQKVGWAAGRRGAACQRQAAGGLRHVPWARRAWRAIS